MSLSLKRTLKVQAEGKTNLKLTLAVNLSSAHAPVSAFISFAPDQPPALVHDKPGFLRHLWCMQKPRILGLAQRFITHVQTLHDLLWLGTSVHACCAVWSEIWLHILVYFLAHRCSQIFPTSLRWAQSGKNLFLRKAHPYSPSDLAPCPCGWEAQWIPVCSAAWSFRLSNVERKFPLWVQAHVLCPSISYHGNPAFGDVAFMLDISHLSLQNTLHSFLPCCPWGSGPVWFISVFSLAPLYS